MKRRTLPGDRPYLPEFRFADAWLAVRRQQCGRRNLGRRILARQLLNQRSKH
jgi:hypothetical protein